MIDLAAWQAAAQTGVSTSFYATAIPPSSGLTLKTISIADNIDYTALGLNASTDLAKGILEVIDPTGTVLYRNVGFNTSYASPDINIITATLVKNGIAFPTDSNGNFILGDYVVNYYVQITYAFATSPVIQILNTSLTRGYNLVQPIGSVKGSYNCGQVAGTSASFTSTDLTNYVLGTLSPDTLTRTHIVTPPTPVIPTTTSSQRVITVNALYTTTWISTVSTYLLYIPVSTVRIYYTVLASDETGVVCDTQMCTLTCCINRLNNDFQNARGRNESETRRLQAIITQVGAEMQIYQQNMICGNTSGMTTSFNLIMSISGCDTDCGCGLDPVPVIGVNGLKGDKGDTGSVGATGATGATGAQGAAGINGVAIEYVTLSPVGTIGNTVERVLDTISVSADLIPDYGDQLLLSTTFTFGQNSHSKTIRIKIVQATVVITTFQAIIPNNNILNNSATYDIRICRSDITTNQQLFKFEFAQSGIPSTVVVGKEYYPVDLSSVFLIEITGQNGTATVDDIVLNEATLTKYLTA